MSQFDYTTIAAAIQSCEHELLAKVRSGLAARLATLEPREALTLTLSRDEHIRTCLPVASVEYVRALIAFCRNQPFNDYAVDSAVTPLAMAAVEQALLDFYASEAVGTAVAAAVIAEVQQLGVVSEVLRQDIESQRDWLQRELAVIRNFDAATPIAIELANATAEQVYDFFQTTVGQKILLVIAKVMSTTAGKALLLKLVKAAIAKILSSAALKSALIAIIKKIGITILMKTVIGKALLALLAFLGIAHIPIVWLILPIIAAFLVHEYKTIPAKLAKRVPEEVVAVIQEKFCDINEAIARRIFAELIANLVDRLTRLQDPRGRQEWGIA